MQLADQIRILQAAQGDNAALAQAAVDLAYPALSEVERQSIKDALVGAAIPHWFDVTILGAILDIPHDDAAARMVGLRTLRAVEPFPARGETARNVHEATRLALRKRLAETDMGRFRSLSSRAARCFADDPNPGGQIEHVYHLLCADPELGASALEALTRDWSSRARPEEHDALASALQELEDGGMVEGRARAWVLLTVAGTRVSRGESAQLMDTANEALRLAQATADPSAQAEAHWLLGDVHEAQGRLEAAQAAFTQALAIFQRLAEQDESNAS